MIPTDPKQWHFYQGDGATCALCGCESRRLVYYQRGRLPDHDQQHRAVDGVFQKRVADGVDWKLAPVASHGRGNRSGPHTQTIELMPKVATLMAEGYTRPEIVEALGIAKSTIGTWEKAHAERWQQQLAQAFSAAILDVQKTAGSPKMMEDLSGHLRRAAACDRWARSKQIRLFPWGAKPTLQSFYEGYYTRVCLDNVCAKSREAYRSSINLWVFITKDPPLTKITTEMLAQFRDCLKTRPAKRGIGRVSAVTVAKTVKHIQWVLDKTGPPGPRNRDAAGILKKSPPWIRPPRIDPPTPRIVPVQRIYDCYQAAVGMDWPELPGIKPVRWWRALLVVALYTGVRRGTIFRMKWEHVDWPGHRLQLTFDIMKGRRHLCLPLHPVVLEHLAAIRGDRERVFPLPTADINRYHTHWHRLQDLAGIPTEDHFGGLQDMRKSFGTAIYGVSPSAAQALLGHRNIATTETHYLQPDALLQRAIAALPGADVFRLSE